LGFSGVLSADGGSVLFFFFCEFPLPMLRPPVTFVAVPDQPPLPLLHPPFLRSFPPLPANCYACGQILCDFFSCFTASHELVARVGGRILWSFGRGYTGRRPSGFSPFPRSLSYIEIDQTGSLVWPTPPSTTRFPLRDIVFGLNLGAAGITSFLLSSEVPFLFS